MDFGLWTFIGVIICIILLLIITFNGRRVG